MSRLWHFLCRVYGMFCGLNWDDIVVGGKGLFRNCFGSKWCLIELPRSSLCKTREIPISGIRAKS